MSSQIKPQFDVKDPSELPSTVDGIIAQAREARSKTLNEMFFGKKPEASAGEEIIQSPQKRSGPRP